MRFHSIMSCAFCYELIVHSTQHEADSSLRTLTMIMIMTKSMGRDYSGRKTTESLGNVKKGKKMERARGSAMTTVGPNMYSITENIYYSQLSSVAILLQPEPHCFTSYNTRKGLCSLSCAIVLRSPPPSHVSTANGQRSSQLFCDHYTSLNCGHQRAYSSFPRSYMSM
jgi:hypothetical protein